MKVYIVQKEEYSGRNMLIGVYATPELAEMARQAAGMLTHEPIKVLEFDVQGADQRTESPFPMVKVRI